MQLCLAAPLRYTQLFGYFIVGIAFNAIEDKDCSCSIWQFRDRLLKANLLIGGFAIIRLGYILYIEAVKKWFLLPQITEGNIGGDSIQPAAKCAIATKTAQFSPRLYKCFLGQILRHITVFAQANTERKHPPHVQLVQLLVGSIIIFARTFDQKFFIFWLCLLLKI